MPGLVELWTNYIVFMADLAAISICQYEMKTVKKSTIV